MKTLTALLLSLSMTSFAVADDKASAYGRNDFYQSGDYAQKELNKRINKEMDNYTPAREPSAYDKKRDEIYEDARRELQEED
jgi:hypothetical protein